MADAARDPHYVSPLVDELCKRAIDTSAAGHIQTMIDAMLDCGIAHTQTVVCSQILVAMCNRGGYGLDPWDVQENISDITETQFHPKLFKGIITDIDKDDFAETIDFNRQQVDASNGILAPVNAQQANYVTLWGGHTTQGFRSARAGMPHYDADLCIDGRLSMVRIAEKCPSYAAALENGASYIVIPSWIFKKHPGLDDAVQAAGNVLQNVAKAENDIQMLQKLYIKISAGQSFDVIKEQFSRTRPKNLAALPHMFNFVRKFPDKKLLDHTIQFIKACKSKVRKINGGIFDVLQLDFKGPMQAPCVRFGVLCTLYVDANDKVLNAALIKGLGNDANLKNTLAVEQELEVNLL